MAAIFRRGRYGAAIAVGAIALFAAAAPPALAAAPGDLDTSFGGDGRVASSGGLGWAEVAIQPDGKIVVVGSTTGSARVARFNPDGSPDTSFNGTGHAVAPDWANSVIFQAGGKIVVGGSSPTRGFAINRYNANGSLDTTFDGDGMLVTDFGSSTDPFDGLGGLAPQTGGKIVAAGRSGGDYALATYNSDGSLDTSFSTDGKLTTDFGGSEGASAVAVTPTFMVAGKIVAVGGGGDFTAARYNPDGSLDTSFSADGKLTNDFGGTDSASDVAFQPADAKIVMVGTRFPTAGTNSDFAVARYNTDGSEDTSFSGDGELTTDFGSGRDGGAAVAIRGDKIVAAGGSNAFKLARYNANGSLDTSFGSGGRVVTTGFAASTSEDPAARGLAIQSDAKIVAVGALDPTAGGGYALARYVGDSTPPPAPTLSATDPASPANHNAPRVHGSAESLADVRLYTTADCSGTPAGSGSATQLASSGIPTSVPDDASSEIRATATDRADNVSPCSAPLTYVEDSLPPPVPTLTETDPPSPADDNEPRVKGSAAFAARVRLYTTPDCSGPESADGLGFRLSSIGGGIEIEVPDNSTTEIRATATDDAGNTSPCSEPITYVEETPAPADPPAVDSGDTPGPGAGNGNGNGTPGSDPDSATPGDPASAPRCGGMPATIVGTPGRDVLKGTRRRDVIAAKGGKDVVRGVKGNDIVCGGGGNDRLKGGAGKDRLLGGGGRDRLAGGPGADLLKGGKGADRLRGGGGRDTLRGGAGRDKGKQ